MANLGFSFWCLSFQVLRLVILGCVILVFVILEFVILEFVILELAKSAICNLINVQVGWRGSFSGYQYSPLMWSSPGNKVTVYQIYRYEILILICTGKIRVNGTV